MVEDKIVVEFTLNGKTFKKEIKMSTNVPFSQAWQLMQERVIKDMFPEIIDKIR